jgi:hypothetical protein
MAFAIRRMRFGLFCKVQLVIYPRNSSSLGKNIVSMPISGKKAHIFIMKAMLVASAIVPSNAEPSPPRPKAKPKNNPETKPTLPGSNSCAYTTIIEKAEDNTKPAQTHNTPDQNKLA